MIAALFALLIGSVWEAHTLYWRHQVSHVVAEYFSELASGNEDAAFQLSCKSDSGPPSAWRLGNARNVQVRAVEADDVFVSPRLYSWVRVRIRFTADGINQYADVWVRGDGHQWGVCPNAVS